MRDGAQLEIAVVAEHRQRALDRLAGGLGTDRPERGAGVRDERASELVRVVHAGRTSPPPPSRSPARRRSGSAGRASGSGASSRSARSATGSRGAWRSTASMCRTAWRWAPAAEAWCAAAGPAASSSSMSSQCVAWWTTARRVVVPVVEVPRHLAVEANPLGGGQRVLDGLADELVPEPDVGGVAGQQAAVLRHREAVVAGAAEHLDGGALDPVRDDGDGPHDLGVSSAGSWPRRADHRVLDAARQPPRRGRDQLGDEERVPTRRVEELGGVPARTRSERGDRILAQRCRARAGRRGDPGWRRAAGASGWARPTSSPR